MESDAKSLKDLEKENKELLLNKTRLEATLEDALLGKVDKLEKPEKTVKPEEKKADHTAGYGRSSEKAGRKERGKAFRKESVIENKNYERGQTFICPFCCHRR